MAYCQRGGIKYTYVCTVSYLNLLKDQHGRQNTLSQFYKTVLAWHVRKFTTQHGFDLPQIISFKIAHPASVDDGNKSKW